VRRELLRSEKPEFPFPFPSFSPLFPWSPSGVSLDERSEILGKMRIWRQYLSILATEPGGNERGSTFAKSN